MKAKITKSWAITLLFTILTAVLPIINEPLQAQFGVVITEAELVHFLTALGITGGLGTAAAVRKQFKKPANPEKAPEPVAVPARQIPQKQVRAHDTFGIKWSGTGWYQTNLVHDSIKGAILPYGQTYLWIRMPDAKQYVAVRLQDDNGNILQIDQSYEKDEDDDISTTRLEMFAKNGNPLPRGTYHMSIMKDGAQGVRDKFEIA